VLRFFSELLLRRRPLFPFYRKDPFRFRIHLCSLTMTIRATECMYTFTGCQGDRCSGVVIISEECMEWAGSRYLGECWHDQQSLVDA